MERGSKCLFNGTVAAYVWCDKKPIHFLSTSHVSEPATDVRKYNATEHRRLPVACPAVVKRYNEFMGGVDRNDQMTRLNKSRKHYKWPHRLMVKFVMWAAFNAFVIMGIKQPGRRKVTFHSFINDLCHELVGELNCTRT